MKFEFSKILPEVAIIQPSIFYDYRGEYVETVYNLTLKLQKQLVDLKYKNNKL